jgi:hypothetical protein
MKNLLLLSNSRMPGREYLEHAIDAIAEMLDDAKKSRWVMVNAGNTLNPLHHLRRKN